jgi:outer membrane immunogenic protein
MGMIRTLAFPCVAIGLCAAIGLSGSAFAADLPPAAPPRAPAVYVPPVLPVYNWSGIYVGVNDGWGFGNAKFSIPGNAAATPPFPAVSGTVTDNGGVAGGTAGVNWQTGGFVFGVEGDWDWSGINTGTTQTICNVTGTCQTGNNWLATLRGRAGYAADRVLFYGTAGGAFANMQTVVNGVTSTKDQAGWTAGAGIEWAFADNWTAKVEYLFVDIGSGTVNCVTGVCTAAYGGAPIPVSVSLTENLIRAGINFKFNGW